MTDLQVYDKAKWHYEGKHYPEKLPEFHAYTHGGFVLAWLLQRGLLSASFLEDHQAAIEKYNAGKITAGQLYELVDGVLDSDMLTDLGNEFAEDYFEESFFEDYEMLFEDDFDEIYAVADNKSVSRWRAKCSTASSMSGKTTAMTISQSPPNRTAPGLGHLPM